jgi:PhzF family phenazine biosynthesis protein
MLLLLYVRRMSRVNTPILSESQRQELEHLYKTSPSHVVRKNCHLVLLKAEGRTSKDVGTILGMTDLYVSILGYAGTKPIVSFFLSSFMLLRSYTQVDAFTQRPFSGNSAAVMLLSSPLSIEQMTLIAREHNVAETSFLLKQDDGYQLRWFTPSVEIALCGHATLAAAHYLYEDGLLALHDTARFHTMSGLLTVTREHDGRMTMNFPVKTESPCPPSEALRSALNKEFEAGSVVYVGKTAFDYFVELSSDEAVRLYIPNMSAIEQLDVRGLIITARSAQVNEDVVSRFFAPQAGVPEDPVTGSAHCAIAPYWLHKLNKAEGEELVCYQASERGGTIVCSVSGDRVFLRGYAVTTMRGIMMTP